MSRLRQGYGGQARTPVISRRVLAVSLTVIAVLVAAPFAIAVVIAERRVHQAQQDTAAIARELDLANVNGNSAVLIGSGNVPQLPSDWAFRAKADLTARSTETSPDPWRNAYLVNAGASGATWVISAGPNGILETPFQGATVAQGDDIAARIR